MFIISNQFQLIGFALRNFYLFYYLFSLSAQLPKCKTKTKVKQKTKRFDVNDRIPMDKMFGFIPKYIRISVLSTFSLV